MSRKDYLHVLFAGSLLCIFKASPFCLNEKPVAMFFSQFSFNAFGMCLLISNNIFLYQIISGI